MNGPAHLAVCQLSRNIDLHDLSSWYVDVRIRVLDSCNVCFEQMKSAFDTLWTMAIRHICTVFGTISWHLDILINKLVPPQAKFSHLEYGTSHEITDCYSSTVAFAPRREEWSVADESYQWFCFRSVRIGKRSPRSKLWQPALLFCPVWPQQHSGVLRL